jgi:hypothetical protein
MRIRDLDLGTTPLEIRVTELTLPTITQQAPF